MYWFYHEYLDEARRFRIHRVDTDTEREARKLHRRLCRLTGRDSRTTLTSVRCHHRMTFDRSLRR